ncbi:MAG TPA: ABC transporter permease [Lacunisphaera sp.]|nr:ABC transporter permease [Lacunisphaera sp.]
MTNLLNDVRHAFRLLAKSPGFTFTAILTLALAIGVNSAIFALVNGFILRPVIPSKPQEVVGVFTSRKDASKDYRQFSYREYAALREEKDVFRDTTAVTFALAGLGRDDGLRRSFVFLTSENFFSFMGVQPVAGRFYTADEARPNANAQVAVASWSYWQRAGGRADFIGSTVLVNTRPYTIIGVAPKGFSGISSLIAPDLWLPLGIFSQLSSAFSDSTQFTDLNEPKNYTLNILGRLAPGLTMESAKARLPALEQRLTALQPADAQGARELQLHPPSRFSISTTPSDDGPLAVMSILMLSMAGVVLVIASLNLANMLLARGTARAREIAVRLAIGATRWQIARQLLVEGLVLALAGGAVGLLLSMWSDALLLHSFQSLLSSMNFSLTVSFAPDPVVLTVTFLFCLFATLVFSLGPALKASRADLVHDLKQQAGDAAAHGRWNRFFAPRHLLVMAQMTLSLVLLFAAGLFFRAALKAGGLNLGFDPKGVVLAEFDFTLANTPQAEVMRSLFAVRHRMLALPGATAAGFSTLVPYGNTTNTTRLVAADAPPAATKTDPNAPTPGAGAIYSSVTPGYFAAAGIHLLRGRDFTENEARDKSSPRVVIVDEAMAKKLFPNRDALGQRVRYTQPPSDGSPAEMEVVGIVNQHRHDVMDKDGGSPHAFVPLAHAYNGSVFLLTRFATADAAQTAALVGTVRTALREVDSTLPILQMRPFSGMLEKSITLWIVRLGAVLFGIFGGIALLLAVVGVYGVKSYAVERRTREIGIRMALGANPGDVFHLVMKQGALQTAVSVVVGVVLSLLVGQALAAILFQVSPMDPLALGVSAVTLSVATLLACFVPAMRATRVSPMTALRTE